MFIIWLKYELENFRGVILNTKCPACGDEKSYQRYVNKNTGEPISNDIGKCNSHGGCSYHKEPEMPVNTPYMISEKIFSESLDYTAGNNLFFYLKNKFGLTKAKEAMTMYSIGTSVVYNNATVLWQIDEENRVRTGKISYFNPLTGDETIKGWVHERLKVDISNFAKCMFGENLIKKEPDKTVVVVENEKVAVEGSCMYPDYIWVSAHGSSPTGRGHVLLSDRKVICEPKTWR